MKTLRNDFNNNHRTRLIQPTQKAARLISSVIAVTQNKKNLPTGLKEIKFLKFTVQNPYQSIRNFFNKFSYLGCRSWEGKLCNNSVADA